MFLLFSIYVPVIFQHHLIFPVGQPGQELIVHAQVIHVMAPGSYQQPKDRHLVSLPGGPAPGADGNNHEILIIGLV